MIAFENKVRQGLEYCGVNPELFAREKKTAGAAVSGGADSVSLLVSLCNIFCPLGVPVRAVTVNHFIRPEKETCGDVAFVKELCASLKNQGFDLELTVCELKKGEVAEYAEKNHCGVEAAARDLRYREFENFIKAYDVDFLALAHNQNDNLETLLMRFLGGSGIDGLLGITPRREKYIRPLLSISRSEIEAYLNQKNIQWCTDLTNLQTDYLRNKIRLKLIPFLDTEFKGWKQALFTASEKNQLDFELINSVVDSLPVQVSGKEAFIKAGDFYGKNQAVKIRLLLKGFNLLGEGRRVPLAFLKDAVNNCGFEKNEKLILDKASQSTKAWSGYQIFYKKEGVFVKKGNNLHTDFVFSDIIEKEGIYEFPFGELKVLQSARGAEILLNGLPVSAELGFPFCVRNAQPDDAVITAGGNLKKLSDIFSDWKVSSEKRVLIPVIQELFSPEQRIVCILGEFLGFKDWIVK